VIIVILILHQDKSISCALASFCETSFQRDVVDVTNVVSRSHMTWLRCCSSSWL